MVNKDYTVVVSGLPRSGTSMIMKMLEAGGQMILTDNIRQADANNPNGYYEFERVKKLKEGDFEWIPDSKGKVVKIITGLIMQLPSDHQYKIIFMERMMNEVLSSQKKMLRRLGKDDDRVADEKMAKIYHEHLKQVNAWITKQQNIKVLYVNYNAMLDDPLASLEKVNEFLGGGVDVNAMAGVVNNELYRERR